MLTSSLFIPGEKLNGRMSEALIWLGRTDADNINGCTEHFSYAPLVVLALAIGVVLVGWVWNLFFAILPAAQCLLQTAVELVAGESGDSSQTTGSELSQWGRTSLINRSTDSSVSTKLDLVPSVPRLHPLATAVDPKLEVVDRVT